MTDHDLHRLDDDGAPPPPDPAVPVPTAGHMAVDLDGGFGYVCWGNRSELIDFAHAAATRARYAESEVLRLRGMVRLLAARIAAAHEVIARNAERAGEGQ